MKIKTITCHHVYNYGATLQAYALQQYLISLGHDSEIINYIPWYHNRYSFWIVNRDSSHYDILNKNVILKLIWCLRYNLPSLLKGYKRKLAFDRFDSKYLRITMEKYTNIDELRLNPPKADVYICGSDQIWNYEATCGVEKAYYLDFGNSDTKRISYAASFGIEKLNKYNKEIKSLINNLNEIYIREKSGARILSELGFLNIDIVLDPVFLLRDFDWRLLMSNGKSLKTPQKYILLYNFKKNDDVKHFVLQLQDILQIPIICIYGYDNITYANLKIKNAGPLEFLSLIDRAEVVVSDSFHATVFSIILKKEFYTFSLNGQNNNARMKDLLETVGIKNRLNAHKPSTYKIDFDAVTERLAPVIEHSKLLLEQINKD